MNRRAVFTGVARNCAAHLPGVLQNLERFAASYRAASFLFVVSDSKDDTRAILERWLADGRRGRVIDLGALEERLTKRTERIAFARNTGLEEIAGIGDAGYDHLVVADLDDVLARPVDADAFTRGSVEDVQDPCNAPAVVWSAQDLAAARAVLALHEDDVTRIVGDGWSRWTDPRVGTDELLAALGLDPVGPFDDVVAHPGNSC